MNLGSTVSIYESEREREGRSDKDSSKVEQRRRARRSSLDLAVLLLLLFLFLFLLYSIHVGRHEAAERGGKSRFRVPSVTRVRDKRGVLLFPALGFGGRSAYLAEWG